MNRFRIEDDTNTLKEVWVGILIYGCICELAGVFFVKDKLYYSFGILAGTITALVYIYHMLWSLEQSIDQGEDFAIRYMRKHNVIRYLALVVLMLLFIYSNFLNPLSWFLGLMGVKAAAYLQPFTHKFLLGRAGREQERQKEEQFLKEYEERVALEGYPEDEDEDEEDEEFF